MIAFPFYCSIRSWKYSKKFQNTNLKTIFNRVLFDKLLQIAVGGVEVALKGIRKKKYMLSARWYQPSHFLAGGYLSENWNGFVYLASELN